MLATILIEVAIDLLELLGDNDILTLCRLSVHYFHISPYLDLHLLTIIFRVYSLEILYIYLYFHL